MLSTTEMCREVASDATLMVKVRVALRLRISRSVCTLCPLSALGRSKLAWLRGSRDVTFFCLGQRAAPVHEFPISTILGNS